MIQKRAAEIEELRRKLEQLQKEYEEVTNMKTSLEKEINTYRELLEGTNNREGLKQIVDHVVEEARRMEAERATGGNGVAGSISYSNGGGGGRSTTISRTFISSSGTSASNVGISGLVSGANRTASTGFGPGSGGTSYSQTSSRREYSTPN
jgi:cobalamin biosynthesis Mg chelatase CobN